MHSFPTGAVTVVNSVAHRITHLLSCSPRGQKSEMGLTELKSRCWQVFLYGNSRGESVPLPLPSSRTRFPALLGLGPCCHLRSVFKPLADVNFRPPSSTYKNPYDYTKPTWILSLSQGLGYNFNFICNLNSPWPPNLICSQRTGRGHLWGHYPAFHSSASSETYSRPADGRSGLHAPFWHVY